MTRTLTGTYRGASAAQRREQRRRRLLDAALDIIGTQGWSATTLRGVCEQARVGPRFFYESFADLDELAATLHDEILETALGHTLEALATAEHALLPRIEAAFRAMIAELLDDPRRARVLFSEAYGSPTLIQRRFAAMRLMAEAMVAQSREFVDLPQRSDQVLKAIALLVTGGVTEFILGWLTGDLGLSRAELEDISVEFAATMAVNARAIADRLGPS